MSVEKETDELDFSAYLQKAGAKTWCAFLLFLVALLCLQWWSTARALQGSSPSTDAVVTWIERNGPGTIVAGYVLGLSGLIGVFLWILNRFFHIFRLPKTHYFYWLKVVFFILTVSEIQWLGTGYISYTWLSAFYARHPVYYETVIRANCATIFLIAGCAIYFVKQKTKLVYGVSEIAISITYNLALLHQIDLSKAPSTTVL
jgi:hypothetical protein